MCPSISWNTSFLAIEPPGILALVKSLFDAAASPPNLIPGRRLRGLSALAARQFFNLSYNAIQVGIPRAKFPRDEIPPALRNFLSVHQHIKLAGAARREHRINPQALLDKGHETRDLSSIVRSSRAMHNFYSHSFSIQRAF